MSLFDLIETDPWPTLKPKIMREREDRLNALLHAATLDGMRQQQGFIEALDWVIEEAKPKMAPRENDAD
jgi:hypothetical protein